MPPKPIPRKAPPKSLPVSTRPDSDRRLRQADRMARVLRVLQLIQRQGRWDAASIARELECSVRTVYRDLSVLELAGVPWAFDKETNSYRVRPDYQFPVLNLTDDELLGQATAAALSKAPGMDAARGAGITSEKLAAKGGGKVESILREAQQFTAVLDLKLAEGRQIVGRKIGLTSRATSGRMALKPELKSRPGAPERRPVAQL